ncbi:polysaccharide deacetylase family protein [Aureimonas psammosilenae]|uniref:polysaccharide deacetylase family protein n=1 Tax=Aureimonas psammosilenae TaxID=2495496 RepID=UPI00126127DE|nr:polysaccharide deacetylase family protein [Aureimonas psammosilenae]
MRDEVALWSSLGDRLDRLSDQTGAPARFWLRDDDAVRPTPALDRLLRIAEDHAMPVALAVIPAFAKNALADRLTPMTGVHVLPHGWAHRNHAPPDEKKTELGDHRPAEIVLAEIAEGWCRLEGFPRRLPVLVPPWNRIGEDVAGGLNALGFEALSLFADKPLCGRGAELSRFDTHLDPIAWGAGGGFVGTPAVLGALLARLDAMGEGRIDPRAPTGILTHHLVQDEATFTFLNNLLCYLARRNDCRFISVENLLANG